MAIKYLQPQIFYAKPKIETTLQTDILTAWQHIITDDLVTAADFLHESQCGLEAGQGTMADFQAIQINRSILYLLMGKFTNAEQSLLLCLQLCQPALEPLLFHTLKLYDCYALLHKNVAKNRAPVQAELQESLDWFHTHGMDRLPDWWHPTIMGEVLAFAIAHGVHSAVAEQLLHHQNEVYGEVSALAALRAYCRCQDPQIRHNVYAVLQRFDTQEHNLLPDVSPGSIRDALAEMLADGPLSSAGFIHLQERLITANQRRKVNWTVVAVFGLYVQRLDRDEIAARLGVSESTVRNSITEIYRCFGLALEDFEGRKARWRRLVAVGLEERLLTNH